VYELISSCGWQAAQEIKSAAVKAKRQAEVAGEAFMGTKIVAG
jgi:hypothetical protein